MALKGRHGGCGGQGRGVVPLRVLGIENPEVGRIEEEGTEKVDPFPLCLNLNLLHP